MNLLGWIRKDRKTPAQQPSNGQGGWGYMVGDPSEPNWRSVAGSVAENSVGMPALMLWIRLAQTVRFRMEEPDGSTWKPVTKANAQEQALLAAISTFDGRPRSAALFQLYHDWISYGDALMLKGYDNAGRLNRLIPVPWLWARPKNDVDNADGSKLVTYYEYRPGGSGEAVPLDPSMVVRLRHGSHPLDPRYGISPLSGAYRDMAAENSSSSAQASSLKNGPKPSKIITPKGSAEFKPATPDQMKEVERRLMQRVGDQTGLPLLTGVPVEIHDWTWSPSEAGYASLRTTPTSRIMAAFGFDPMVLGLPSDSKTYSNYEEALDAAGKHGVLPVLQDWGAQLADQCFPDWRVSPINRQLGLDDSGCWWLRDDTDNLHDRIRKTFAANLLDQNEARQELGLDELPDGAGRFYLDMQAAARGATAPSPQDLAAKRRAARIAERLSSHVPHEDAPDA